NARFNFDKTQAMSLSGETQPRWFSMLACFGINSCQDRSSTTPVIYLGFPLCSSVAQEKPL
ncbi:hypothetical protein BX666DRAFT_1841883, partial [Dichotomocladium elegans]